jgi:hypothetical protein
MIPTRCLTHKPGEGVKNTVRPAGSGDPVSEDDPPAVKELLDLLATKSVLTNLFPDYPQKLWTSLCITRPSGIHPAVIIVSDTDWRISDHVIQIID